MIVIVVYVSDFKATARHLCVRHALAYHEDFVSVSMSFDKLSSQADWDFDVLCQDHGEVRWTRRVKLGDAASVKDVHLSIKRFAYVGRRSSEESRRCHCPIATLFEKAQYTYSCCCFLEIAQH